MTFFFMCEYPSNFCLNLIPKPAGEPVFLVFSEHISSWYNNGDEFDKEYTQVEVAYPRWKFLPQSSINYIIQGGQIFALDEEEKAIKSLALEGEPDPDDPNPPVKKKSPVPAQSPQLALPPGPSKQMRGRSTGRPAQCCAASVRSWCPSAGFGSQSFRECLATSRSRRTT